MLTAPRKWINRNHILSFSKMFLISRLVYRLIATSYQKKGSFFLRMFILILSNENVMVLFKLRIFKSLETLNSSRYDFT